MRILSLVLAFADASWTRRCLERIDTDLLIIDNGAHDDVRPVIIYWIKNHNAKYIRIYENILVNPAWNIGMTYFLQGDWTHLVIINSDLVLHKDWSKLMPVIWEPDKIPCVLQGRSEGEIQLNNESHEVEVCEGIFIFLSREQVEKVFPVPHQIKLWFGDDYIYRKLGLKKYCYHNLVGIHGNSRGVSVTPNKSEIIERDKIEWEKLK